MSVEVLLQTDRIQDARREMLELKRKTEDLKTRLEGIGKTLTWQVSSEQAIGDNIKKLCNELTKQAAFMESAAQVCTEAVTQTENTNRGLLAAIGALLLKIVGIASPAGVVITAASKYANIGKPVPIVAPIFTTKDSGVTTSTAGTGTGSTSWTEYRNGWKINTTIDLNLDLTEKVKGIASQLNKAGYKGKTDIDYDGDGIADANNMLVDCAGFTSAIWIANGKKVDFTNDPNLQNKSFGTQVIDSVDKGNSLQVGDILVYTKNGSNCDHVDIVVKKDDNYIYVANGGSSRGLGSSSSQGYSYTIKLDQSVSGRTEGYYSASQYKLCGVKRW